MLGIDVLQANNFDLLRGQKVGLVTNQTGVNRSGEKTRVILHRSPEVNLVALYTPEHGLDGKEKAGAYVSNRTDSLTGLTAYSLYGKTRKPTPEMLRGINTLVYDMQDIGCRSYTYISTMLKCMDACAEQDITFVVLDRPNPVGGILMEGPMIENRWLSFVGQVPVPYRHGMTAGEIAYMANNEKWLESRKKCRLRVIKMSGWHRNMVWGDTGLRWTQTSPNIPHGESPFYYIATGIAGSVKGGGFDIGIGSRPFEIIRGRFLGDGFYDYMKQQRLPGVKVSKISGGVRFHINPRATADLTSINLHIISYANRNANPDLFARYRDEYDILWKVYGSKSLQDDIRAGKTPAQMVKSWENDVQRFARQRQKYLLY